MKLLTNILACVISVVCFSLTAFAEPSGRAFGSNAPSKAIASKKDPVQAAPSKSKDPPKKKVDKSTASRKEAEAEGKGLLWLWEPWNVVVRAVMNGIASVDPIPPDPVPPQQKKAQEEAEIKEHEQEHGAQFRRLYKSELHFMRLVCKPTRQQFEKIAKDGPTEKAIIRNLAVMLRDAQQGLPGDDRPQMDPVDPRRMIAARLSKSLPSILSAEQTARYQKELDQRDAARKRVALLGLVAKVDKLLNLTVEQRGRLSQVLENNWHDSWNQTQTLLWGGRYFPPMPDKKILPILTETQKAVWLSMPPNEDRQFGFDWECIQGWWNAEIEEEKWDDETPAENQQPKKDKAAVKDQKAAKPEKK